MASQFGSRASGIRVRMRDDFVDGLKCFKSDDYEGALMFFRAADECAAMDDIYQGRYTSFHGLSRVCMGDRSGVKLCRKAVVGETQDAEVYYNLAMAENRLGFRESACMALRRGLKIDPGHSGLLRLKQKFVLRGKHGFIPGLKRSNFLNRLIGKLFRGTRLPYPDQE
ncbi:MAG: hypothetical protein ABFS24_08050 [Pseudomonadota bacterium]